ncbi:MAG: type I polyketide synthase [Cyanobacteria bacterium J06621_11]
MEPIAIIGIGCRFPGANSPDAFWQLLETGQQAIREIPNNRWEPDHFYHPDPATAGKTTARKGGFIDDVSGFDAAFFGISPQEARHIDPQQRLFLEVAWEALENAAIPPLSLGGSHTGVFTGLCTIDYHRLLYKDFGCIGPHSGTGTTMSITANRLSYLLNLRGPSMAVDAACSSSLISAHLACQSLRAKESNLCIVGGVNLILSPDSMISSSQTGLLSTKGECRPFDANADGYVRGEGCGVVILKRLLDAVADRDPILAIIKGSATNQDGLSNSLTAPNGLAQQALLQRALATSGITPEEIDYIEAHAVGTLLGDAIEFKALKKIFATEKRSQPCILGSVKSNIGHLEAASGIAALIKVVLSLQHEKIPPQLNFDQANTYVNLVSNQFEIATGGKDWLSQKNTQKQQPRTAGVSTFGFGGSNAHLVVSEAPRPSEQIYRTTQSPITRPWHILTFTAKTPTALQALIDQYARAYNNNLKGNLKEAQLSDICFTANTGRSHFSQRLCLISQSKDHLQQQLKQLGRVDPQQIEGAVAGNIKGRKRPKIVFHFPEPTAQTLTLGRTLYQTQPTFRQIFDSCLQQINSKRHLPLQQQLDNSFSNKSTDSKQVIRLKSFIISYAIALLWQRWGISPKAVSGTEWGRNIAACLSGTIELTQAIETLFTHESWQTISFNGIASNGTASRIPVLTGDLTGYDIVLPMSYSDHFTAEPNWIVKNQTIENPLPKKYFLQSDADIWPQILNQVAQLFVRGVAIDWHMFDSGYSRDRISLPTYPFERSPHWFTQSNSPSTASLSNQQHP